VKTSHNKAIKVRRLIVAFTAGRFSTKILFLRVLRGKKFFLDSLCARRTKAMYAL